MAELRMKQGKTWRISFRWANPDGTPIDITGWTAKLQVRRSPDLTSASALTLTSNPAAGLTVDGPNGTVTGRASPTQTAAIAAGRYVFECEITDGTDTESLTDGAMPITVAPEVVGP
jgi:hypothetical protein